MKTIIRRVNDGEASVQDSVWKEGWNSFVTILNIPEFMEQVKPDVLQGGKKPNKKKGSAGAALAAAIGLGKGGSSVPRARWYRSTPFLLLAFLIGSGGLYQAARNGVLDQALAPLGMVEKAKTLPPIPTDQIVETVMNSKKLAWPLWGQLVFALPEPLQTWLAPIQLPEGLKPSTLESLREAVFSDPEKSIQIASGLPVGDELNPSFVITSNLPDGAELVLMLRGKEGTLLNAITFEKKVIAEIQGHVAVAQKFTYEGNKPLPRGEYILAVYESDKQPIEVKEVLASAEAKGSKFRAKNDLVPAQKVAFSVDTYFLGGKKDATYQARLKDFNDRIRGKLTQEANELRQVALFLESLANDGANQFSALAQQASGTAKTAAWKTWSEKHAKMITQLSAMVAKSSSNNQEGAEILLSSIYHKASNVQSSVDRLHKVQAEYLTKGGDFTKVRQEAVATSALLGELKQAIIRVIK
jgi:hypothetical protein